MYADYLQAERDNRRNFMRRLDHEIKNPLTGLRAALVNLKETKTDEERQRAVGNANRAVERLIRLLTDLRKLSELEERTIERYPVDVPELLDDVVTAARVNPAYEGREVNLLIPKIPSPFPRITGDRDLLLLAAYNLVENALKFTSAQDSIEVRALEDGRAIVIEVADTGAGIPPEDLSKIFEELVSRLQRARHRGQRIGAGAGQPHCLPARRRGGSAFQPDRSARDRFHASAAEEVDSALSGACYKTVTTPGQACNSGDVRLRYENLRKLPDRLSATR
jgi:two-component system, OmpR family, sensor kinase